MAHPDISVCSRPFDIHQFVQFAINSDGEVNIGCIQSAGEAQSVLDEVWKILDSSAVPSAATGGTAFFAYRNKLRRLCVKLVVSHNVIPRALVLRGVEVSSHQQHGCGAFGDVFQGRLGTCKIAVKKLRVSEIHQEEAKKALSRESIIWRSLVHKHIVPFLGVSEDIFVGNLCMVIPWYEHDSLRHFLSALRKQGNLDDVELINLIYKWLYQTALGLEYLHCEGIVHGDLHAGNILIDDNGNACLTDFGMSLITQGTAYKYGSVHGGGATHWQAPELIDPEEFDSNSTRPTPQSDVYSFACTALELYTGKPPFSELTSHQVFKRYIRGVRPPRPMPPGTPMPDELWALVQSWWTQQPSARPFATAVAASLRAYVPVEAGVDGLWAQLRVVDIQTRIYLPSAHFMTSFLGKSFMDRIPCRPSSSFVSQFSSHIRHLDDDSAFFDAILKLRKESCSTLNEQQKDYFRIHGDDIGDIMSSYIDRIATLWTLLQRKQYALMTSIEPQWQTVARWLSFLLIKTYGKTNSTPIPLGGEGEVAETDWDSDMQEMLNLPEESGHWSTAMLAHRAMSNVVHAVAAVVHLNDSSLPPKDSAERLAFLHLQLFYFFSLIRHTYRMMTSLDDLTRAGVPGLEQLIFGSAQIKEFENIMYARIFGFLVWVDVLEEQQKS